MSHSNFLDPEEGVAILGRSWEDNCDLSACLVECAKRLHARGFIAATDGNMSVRLGDDEIWITPPAVMKAFVRPDDMAVVTLQNEVEKGIASTERSVHLTVYNYAPLARAVIHAFPPHAIALTLAYPSWTELPGELMAEIILSAGRIPILPFTAPASRAMSDELAKVLPAARLIIMARHGVLAWGESLDEAYAGIERVDHVCRVLHAALTLPTSRDGTPGGSPSRLSSQILDDLRQTRARTGAKIL